MYIRGDGGGECSGEGVVGGHGGEIERGEGGVNGVGVCDDYEC